jgi:ABC-type nitrate/sulfonate/bicarbonate transport system substrate-binding protein
MRKFLFVSFAIFMMQESVQAMERIRLSVANLNVTFFAAGVAQKKGFFKEVGLETEVIRMAPPTSIMALSSGDIGYTMGVGSVTRAAIRGLPVKVIAGFVDSSAQALVALPEFKSVKELKGRTLGIGAYGAADHVVALMMLQHFGIDTDKEIKVVALGADRARLAALKQQVVHVIVVSPPADFEGKRMGFNVLTKAYELFSFPIAGLGTTVRRIEERPDEVKRVIKSLIKANRFIRDNRDGAIQILAEWGRTDWESTAASYDSTVKVFSPDGSIPEDGFRLIIDQAKKDAKVTRDIPLSEVSDLTILREAQRELGIKGR